MLRPTEKELNLITKMQEAGMRVPDPISNRFLYRFYLSAIASILNHSKYYVRNWIRPGYYSPYPKNWFQRDLKGNGKSPWYLTWDRMVDIVNQHKTAAEY